LRGINTALCESHWIDLESIQTEPGGSGQLFRYTFHAPDDPASLGNDLETIIGPGDSGGPAFIQTADGLLLVGINTFTEGFGGRFGDIGGGVLLDPDNLDWILTTTGIPEPSVVLMVVWAVSFWCCRRRVGDGLGWVACPGVLDRVWGWAWRL